ncbi:MAG: 16S rRNA (uracil(1498)-N(3))-methyltransferase [Geminicoccaceae bacterium]|nr:16S rRNA (uracil(1498)-N(3))-methyltransferase [Geminicoccaceae bacterium]
MTPPRLHHAGPLDAGAEIRLGSDEARYLGSVLRLRSGHEARLFNADAGEWRCRIEALDRRGASLRPTERLRPPVASGGPRLLLAAIKRPRLEMVLEKATELGVGRIDIVTTARAVVEPARPDRLAAKLKEAAEQCGRLDLPALAGPVPLAEALASALKEGAVLAADERRDGRPLLDAIEAHPGAAFLVGPEGGFAPEEREGLRRTAGVVSVRLGPAVLRAETAAMATLAGALLARDRGTA